MCERAAVSLVRAGESTPYREDCRTSQIVAVSTTLKIKQVAKGK